MASKTDAPPSYAQATGSSTASSRLEVPGAHNGIPAAARRSMEDEQRPLPTGWVRQWDNKEQHHFYVDTKADPPRSIWQHPYDDDDYLKTLSSEEREHIQEQERERLIRIHGDTTDDEGHSPSKSKPKPSIASAPSYSGSSTAPEISGAGDKKKEKAGFGRRLKDKVTGSTHEERQAERAQREREEAAYYEAHMKFRAAMQRAQMTGEPQLLGKDRDGKDVYVEPPRNAYGGGGYGGYGSSAYGYNPYTSGPYSNPNARFIRPAAPYGRPYGGYYGGGMGMPIAGGLLGGMLLGGLLF